LTAVGDSRSRPRRLYVDTSAYLCLLLGEAESDELKKETAGAELLSSVLLVLETRRNLVRLAREALLPPADYRKCVDRLEVDLDLLLLRDLTLDLCDVGAIPAVMTPRSLDLAHLRTALWFHAQKEIDRFLSMDETQQQAAKELGLPI
jgi:predicted nucleic acid-binding protein